MAPLTEQDFNAAAQLIGCEVAAIKAVCEIEAPRGGFNPDSSPVTLFEGHKFYQYTQGKFASSDPDLCYRSWTKQFYGKTWKEEQVRLKRAMQLDERAALMSTSWGRFQIMGFNFNVCGFDTVEHFVENMRQSEADQLTAFCQFVIANKLAVALKTLAWADFARGYNGSQYAVNQYDKKLAMAYERAQKI